MTRYGPRFLFLAAILITGLVLFREHQLQEWQHRPAPVPGQRRSYAPQFELPDQNRHLVKLSGMLGRERIVLLFLEDGVALEDDSRFQRLLSGFDAMQQAGFKVIVVTALTRFEIQQDSGQQKREFPFPVLTDIHPQLPMSVPAHRAWGRYDSTRDRGLSGLFLIARDGSVAVNERNQPLPSDEEDQILEQLSRGEWPERE